jgi:hypothetical protein
LGSGGGLGTLEQELGNREGASILNISGLLNISG